MKIGDLLNRNARRFPQKDGVICEKNRLTFKQLNSKVNKIANSLVQKGFTKGDKVAFLAENCLELFEMYFVAAKTGIVLVPLNYRLNAKELSYLINHSEAKALMFEANYMETVDLIKDDIQNVEEFYLVDEIKSIYSVYQSYSDLLMIEDDTEPNCMIDEEDLYLIIYTGGTTGLPKGVMLTQKNILASALECVLTMDIKADDISVYVLPLFHVSNWTIFGHLYLGATNIVVRKWDADAVLKLISDEKATHINMVPTMVSQFLQQYEKKKSAYKLNSLRTISYAGSPMPVEVLKTGLRLLGNRFFQVFGLTEASPLVSYLTKEDHESAYKSESLQNRLDSCGKEMPNVQVKIIKNDGEQAKPLEVGEVTVFGDNVMMGYWKDEKQTEEAIRFGWLFTGDLGIVDEDGWM